MGSKAFTHDELQKVFVEKGYTLGDWLDELRTVVSDVKDLANAIKASFTSGLLSAPSLAIGSTVQNVATGAFYYMVNGAIYAKAAVAVGTAPGNDIVPQSKYGAIALDIGINGTIDVIEASANVTGYDSAILALAGLPAAESGHVRIGTVTATKSDGAFTFGTTALNAANSTVAYADGSFGMTVGGSAVSSSLPFAFNA